MLGKKYINKINLLSKQYQIKKVYLFGSSVAKKNFNDYDLAVSGLAPQKYFEFYGKLILSLPKPVDLVDLSEVGRFFKKSIISEGKLIYERH